MAAAASLDPKTMRTSASSIICCSRASPCAKTCKQTCCARKSRSGPAARWRRAKARNVPVRSWLRDPPLSKIRLPVSVSSMNVSGPSRLTLLGSQTATVPRGRATRAGRPVSTGRPNTCMKGAFRLSGSRKAMRYAHSSRLNSAGAALRMAARSPLQAAASCAGETGSANAVTPEADSNKVSESHIGAASQFGFRHPSEQLEPFSLAATGAVAGHDPAHVFGQYGMVRRAVGQHVHRLNLTRLVFDGAHSVWIANQHIRPNRHVPGALFAERIDHTHLLDQPVVIHYPARRIKIPRQGPIEFHGPHAQRLHFLPATAVDEVDHLAAQQCAHMRRHIDGAPREPKVGTESINQEPFRRLQQSGQHLQIGRAS